MKARLIKEWEENGLICQFLQLEEKVSFVGDLDTFQVVLATNPSSEGRATLVYPAQEVNGEVIGRLGLGMRWNFAYPPFPPPSYVWWSQLEIVSVQKLSATEVPENNHTCVLCKNHRCNKLEKACWKCGHPIGG